LLVVTVVVILISLQVTATRWHSTHARTFKLLQLLDLACGTLFQSSCAIQTSSTDCSDNS